METQTHNPKQSISKHNHYKGQKQRVFEALNKNPKTMLMLSVETGIMRAIQYEKRK